MSDVLSDSLSSVLEAYIRALNSIDVRTVAVRSSPQDEWTNLITSIFVSAKSIEDVQAEHKAIPKIMNERFAIFYKATANSKISPLTKTIFEEINQGKITFNTNNDTVVINCRQSPLLTLKMSTSPILVKGILKSALRLTELDKNQERGKLWAIVTDQYLEAKKRRYPDIVFLIKDALDTDYLGSREIDFDVSVTPSVKIDSVTIEGSLCKVKVGDLSGLKGLQLNFALGRPNYHIEPPWSGEASLDDYKPSGDSVEVTVEPSNMLPLDMMHVELIHKNVPLCISVLEAQVPLENTTEPFLKALNAFCSIEEFQKMLFAPETYTKPADKFFENAVAWLLALAGYSVVNLNPAKNIISFEKIKAPETDVEIGTADLLAYEENKRLLLIDCDINGVDNNKVQSVVNAKKYLEKLLDLPNGFSIVPAICTPKECDPIENGVAIVDCRVLKSILEEVTKGNSEKARNKIFGY
jgi:hypothetical protein